MENEEFERREIIKVKQEKWLKYQSRVLTNKREIEKK